MKLSSSRCTAEARAARPARGVARRVSFRCFRCPYGHRKRESGRLCWRLPTSADQRQDPVMPEDDAGHAGGLSSGPGAFVSAGEVICELRSGLGWSQGRLADELGRVSGHPITREYVSRWEHGRKTPGPFWIGHLAAVLQVPRWALEGHVKRREMLRLTGAAAAAAFMGAGKLLPPDSEDLFSSVAAG